MTTRAKQLIGGTFLTTVQSSYYTAPASTTAVLQRATLSNISGNTVTATVWLVPAGGTVGNQNQLINARSLIAGETYVSPELGNKVLQAGGQIQALASQGSAINIDVSGVEIT